MDDPRLYEFPGGLLLNRHGANPGLAAVLAAWRRIWLKLRLPIILTLASNDVRQWPQVAARVARFESIAALELELNEVYDAREGVGAVRAETDLPLLAKVPTERVLEVSEAALEGGANALVVGRTPRGALRVGERFWEGRIMGPAARPLVLRAVKNVAGRFPETPVVASGGVHQVGEDVEEMLAAGALAVEVDVALWRDPESIDLSSRAGA
jgi:dihydroorotate dehydrogenase